MKSKFNKRGSVQDALFIGIMGVMIVIGLVLAAFVYSQLSTALSTNIDLPVEVSEPQDEFSAKFPRMLDAMFLIVLIGAYLGTFVLSFFIDSHPVFFVITALVFSGTIIVVPFLLNAYQTFAATQGIATTITTMPITAYIMNHYLQFTIVMWGLVAIGIYSKRVAN